MLEPNRTRGLKHKCICLCVSVCVCVCACVHLSVCLVSFLRITKCVACQQITCGQQNYLWYGISTTVSIQQIICGDSQIFADNQQSANYLWYGISHIGSKVVRADTMQMKEHYHYQPGIKEAAGNSLASAGKHTKSSTHARAHTHTHTHTQTLTGRG